MSHPLICWDIILEGRIRRDAFATDLRYLKKMQEVFHWPVETESFLENALLWENKTILITTNQLEILFASKNITDLNGYRPQDIIGKSLSLFEGPFTQESSLHLIHSALEKKQSFSCTLLNYRKDGSVYNCQLTAVPVFSRQGKLVHYFATEEAIPLLKDQATTSSR